MYLDVVEVSGSAEWRDLYLAALVELDERKLPIRVQAAEEVMRRRLAELKHEPDSVAEWQALQDGLNSLAAISQHAKSGRNSD